MYRRLWQWKSYCFWSRFYLRSTTLSISRWWRKWPQKFRDRGIHFWLLLELKDRPLEFGLFAQSAQRYMSMSMPCTKHIGVWRVLNVSTFGIRTKNKRGCDLLEKRVNPRQTERFFDPKKCSLSSCLHRPCNAFLPEILLLKSWRKILVLGLFRTNVFLEISMMAKCGSSSRKKISFLRHQICLRQWTLIGSDRSKEQPIQWSNFFVVNNLPREIRFKEENVILAGIIPGPEEPSDLNPFLHPIVEMGVVDMPGSRRLGHLV